MTGNLEIRDVGGCREDGARGRNTARISKVVVAGVNTRE